MLLDNSLTHSSDACCSQSPASSLSLPAPASASLLQGDHLLAGWLTSNLTGAASLSPISLGLESILGVAPPSNSVASGGFAAPPPAFVADFNGDGWSDLPWYDAATDTTQIWLLNQTGFTGTLTLPALNRLGWQIQGIEDFNKDSKVDLLWHNPNTSESQVWLLDGSTLLTQVALPTIAGGYRLAATGNFSGAGTDLLWRNPLTGENKIWQVGADFAIAEFALPTIPGVNLSPRITGDFDKNGKADIVWQNSLTGQLTLWRMDGLTVIATEPVTDLSNLPTNPPGGGTPTTPAPVPIPVPISVFEPTTPPLTGPGGTQVPPVSTTAPTVTSILDWHLAAIADLDGNGTTELLFKQTNSDATLTIDDATFASLTRQFDDLGVNWQQVLQSPVSPPATPLELTNFSFDYQEGSAGTFQIRLTSAPLSPINLVLDTGNFLVVDANGTLQDGTQLSLVFTPQDWNQPRTISFIAEIDDTDRDRALSNWVSFTLYDSLTNTAIAQVVQDLGTVFNTNTPNLNQFNIDLDFRNDYTGFWTPERQAVARRAAADWSSLIANEWAGFTLNNRLNRLDSFGGRTVGFNSKRAVDDLLVFVNVASDSSPTEAALGGPDYEFGGWITSPDIMPRVGQLFVNPSVYSNYSNDVLYQAVSHELGHVLGLVGLNWQGYNLINRLDPSTSTFNGAYSTAFFGAPIPMQTQDGGDFAHPAARVPSIMSYGYLYTLPGPTKLDFAMLADSGYQIQGINYSVSM